MKRYQTYKRKSDNVEVAMQPMEIWNESQGMYTGVSHKKRPAVDLIGTYGIKDDVLASWTMEVHEVRTTEVFTKNVYPVLFKGKDKPFIVPAGQAITKLYHDNYVADLKKYQIIKQGTPFYQEGTYGGVGMHVHLEVGIYAIQSANEYLAEETGESPKRYRVKGAVRLDEVYFSNDTDIQRSSYTWVKFPEDQLAVNVKTYSGVFDADFWRQVQKSVGTVQDGIMSGQKVLMSNVSVMRIGKNGSDCVRAIQRKLNEKGYKLAIDGLFGPVTLKAWQTYVGTLADACISKNSAFVKKVRQLMDEGVLWQQ